MVYAADESKVVVQGFGWLYRIREARTTACLLFEGGTKNQGIWEIIGNSGAIGTIVSVFPSVCFLIIKVLF